MSIRYLIESVNEAGKQQYLTPADEYSDNVNAAKVFDDLFSADCYACERDYSVKGRQHVVHPYHVA